MLPRKPPEISSWWHLIISESVPDAEQKESNVRAEMRVGCGFESHQRICAYHIITIVKESRVIPEN